MAMLTTATTKTTTSGGLLRCARHNSMHFIYAASTHWILTTTLLGLLSPVLQTRNLRHRVIKGLSQALTANVEQTWDRGSHFDRHGHIFWHQHRLNFGLTSYSHVTLGKIFDCSESQLSQLECEENNTGFVFFVSLFICYWWETNKIQPTEHLTSVKYSISDSCYYYGFLTIGSKPMKSSNVSGVVAKPRVGRRRGERAINPSRADFAFKIDLPGSQEADTQMSKLRIHDALWWPGGPLDLRTKNSVLLWYRWISRAT